MDSKKLNAFLAVLVILLLIGVGYLIVNRNSNDDTLSASQQKTEQDSMKAAPTKETMKDEASTSQNNTYSNTKYGFSFEYPKDWYAIESDNGEGGNVMEVSFAKSSASGHTLSDIFSVHISARQYYGETPLTLDGAIKDLPKTQYTLNNPKNVQLGVVNAKRFDDGGGLFGTTYTTVAVGKGFTYILSSLDTQNTAADLISKTFKITK